MVEDQKKRSEFYDNVHAGEEFRIGKKKRSNYLDEYWEIVHYGYIADRFSKENFQSTLAIGVGGGLTLKYIHEKCPDVKMAGMDISQKILKGAQSNFEEWGMDVDLFSGDAYSLSEVSDNKYDAVLLIDVIEHLEDPVKALSVANRIAKKEVIINVPSRQSIWTLLSPRLRKQIVYLETKVQYWLGHYRLYTYKSLKREVNSASMDIVDFISVRPISVSIYPFWRINFAQNQIAWLYKTGMKLERTGKFNQKLMANSILAYCREK